MQNSESLIVIDTNAYAHALIFRIEETLKVVPDLGGENLSRFIKLVAHSSTSYLLSNLVFGSLCPGETRDYVFCQDTKEYWREFELKQYGINYKGKRARTSQKVSCLAQVNKAIKEYLRRKGVSIFSCRTHNQLGYEADDLAAGIVQTIANDYKRVILFTDDSDWLPLINKKIWWYGIHHRYPRLRNDACFKDWRLQSYSFNQSKSKKNFPMSSFRDVWDFKVRFGDSSDNIPARSKAKGIDFTPYINLFNPLPGYKCWEQEYFQLEAGFCVHQSSTYYANTENFRLNFAKYGKFPIFTSAYDDQDMVKVS